MQRDMKKITIDGQDFHVGYDLHAMLTDIVEERDAYLSKIQQDNKWLECDTVLQDWENEDLAENLGIDLESHYVLVPSVVNLSLVGDFRMATDAQNKLQKNWTFVRYEGGETATLDMPFQEFKQLFYEFRGLENLSDEPPAPKKSLEELPMREKLLWKLSVRSTNHLAAALHHAKEGEPLIFKADEGRQYILRNGFSLMDVVNIPAELQKQMSLNSFCEIQDDLLAVNGLRFV